MVSTASIYQAESLHAALFQAGIAIEGVSTSPSGTVVHCSDELSAQVQDFLAVYQDPATPAPAPLPPTLEELQAQIAELQSALLDLLIGGGD